MLSDDNLPLALRKGETTEQLKVMMDGKPYRAVDRYLMRLRQWAQDNVQAFNKIGDMEERMAAMRGFIRTPELGEGEEPSVFITSPFYFEYGFMTTFGREVYLGPNSTIVDVCPVTFGDRTMVGANCSFYTPNHPTSPEARNGLKGPEWASPISIGNDCWIGGSVVVIGPCKIGNGVTIGAGSVITRDIPDRCIAVGNPARVIKKINADGTSERVHSV